MVDVVSGLVEDKKVSLIYRQSIWTRVTHWMWAVSLFFLLLSGLQIFNAHPTLYLGEQSGFGFDNSIFSIGAQENSDRLTGNTNILGLKFDTTGLLGVSGEESNRQVRAFPSWATLPSGRNLATGRLIHIFFAWVLVGTLIIWLVASLMNGHLRRDIVPSISDLKSLPHDIANHIRFKFHHTGSYNVMQKLSYAAVLLVFLPLMIATGLAMSPGINSIFPWLSDVLGGRQTARTLHFIIMVMLGGFFIVHIAMVVASGPINEMRSIITGWYRVDPPNQQIQEKIHENEAA